MGKSFHHLFFGRAASWLRSSKAHVRFSVWEDFFVAVSNKFDRDQHDLLIRQMDSIKLFGTVWEYYEKFDELMNQLQAYDLSVNMRYLHIDSLMDYIVKLEMLFCFTILVTSRLLWLLLPCRKRCWRCHHNQFRRKSSVWMGICIIDQIWYSKDLL